jgi:UDPglucose 6-dehydrogenase
MNVAVIGLGKLGLPLLALLAKSQHTVLGYDKSPELRAVLTANQYNFYEPDLNDILKAHTANIKIVSSIERAVKDSDVIFVIVPTPTDSTLKFSNDYIIQVLDEFSKALEHKMQYCIINIVSTVMPNSCIQEFIPHIEAKSGKKVNVDFGFTYNPEFIALGSVIQNMEYPDMHLIGSSDKKSGEIVQEILRDMSKNDAPSMMMNLTEAEIVKISVNNFVTMKISFANMLMQLASKFEDVNIDTVTNAIGLDTRIGKKYLRAGTSYGGPCFPRDTRAMSALFEEYLLANALPKVVGTMNDSHNDFLAIEITKIAKAKNYSKIGIVGMSYKEDSYVLDESPSVFLAKYLIETGFEVSAWDPMLQSMLHEFPGGVLALTTLEELLGNTDLVVLPRTISENHLNSILNIKKSLTIFDPWGQVTTTQSFSHEIIQLGRSNNHAFQA